MGDVGLTTALRRIFQNGVRGAIPYCLPFLIVVVSFRVITLIVHRYGGTSAVWMDMVLLFVVCYPENFLAEIWVAHIYLREESTGATPLPSGAIHRISRRDVAALIARVVVRSVAWLFAFVGFLLLEILVVSVAMKLTHSGSPRHIGKSLNHVLVEAAFVLYAGVCSRYSFVFPLFAFREAWHSDALVDGVRLAKRHWRVLWALAMAVSAGLLLGHDLSKWALVATHSSRTTDRAVQIVGLILTAVLTGYFTVLKTELMRQASEQASLPQGTA